MKLWRVVLILVGLLAGVAALIAIAVYGIGNGTSSKRARSSWQSKIYFDVNNSDELSQNKRGVLGFRLTGRALQTNSEMSLWIKNTLDETYRTAGFSLGAYVNRYYALPRTYGVTFTQQFGGI